MTETPTGSDTGTDSGETAGDTRSDGGVALRAALIDEATKKSGLVWVAARRPRERWYAEEPASRPVWLLWQDGAAYVVSGPGEQPAHDLEPGVQATVTVRSKDKGGRLLSWVADVARLAPDDPAWDEVVPGLLGKRLNLPDGEAAGERWRAECTVLRLTPTGTVVEEPGTMPDESGAAPPPDTPATTYTRVPFTIGSATSKRPRRERHPER